MRPVDCVSEEALGEILALPESDPRRAHLRECPRCRALVTSYESFMAAAEDEAYGPRERAVLDAARERMLGVPAKPAVVPIESRRPKASPWLAPAWRPALAAAVVIVVAAGALVLPRLRSPEHPSAVRGLGDRPLSLAEPHYEAGDAVRLVWRSFPGADGYEVRFYTTALEPVGAVTAGADTAFVVTVDRLPAAYLERSPLLYRIAARRGEDDLALSPTGTLQRP